MRVIRCSDGLPLAAPDELPVSRLLELAAAADRDEHITIFSGPEPASGWDFRFGWAGARPITGAEGYALTCTPLVRAAATRMPDRWGARIRQYLVKALREFSDDQLEDLAHVGLAAQVVERPELPPPEDWRHLLNTQDDARLKRA